MYTNYIKSQIANYVKNHEHKHDVYVDVNDC